MAKTVQQVTIKQSEYIYASFFTQGNNSQHKVPVNNIDLFTANPMSSILQDITSKKNIPFDKASEILFDKLFTSEVLKLWEFKTGGRVLSSPCIGSDGTIYVGSYDGNIYAIGAIRDVKQILNNHEERITKLETCNQ